MKMQTKIIIRRLPKCMTKDQFLNSIQPFKKFNYFRFCYADKLYNEISNTRVYIDFFTEDDMYAFKNEFDNRLFIDDEGNESYVIIEFAAFQKVAIKDKYDSKQNTVSTDPDYMKFIEEMNETTKNSNIGTVESNLEEIKTRDAERANATTALVEYVNNLPKKDRGRRDDYRRRPDSIKQFPKKDFDNATEKKNPIKMEVKVIKKNNAKDIPRDVPPKSDISKSVDKVEHKSKVTKRNDIKTYAANYEEYGNNFDGYVDDRVPNKTYGTKQYRCARQGAYEAAEESKSNSGMYYGNGRNDYGRSDGFYRGYDYGGPGVDYGHTRPPIKNKRGGGQRPPSYSATRKE